MMYEYITDSFAGILTKGDVVVLFNELIEHYKENRSRAARKVGVTPATTYGWEHAKYIKHGTKKKVLKALLECRHLIALEYLLNRTNDRQTDILRTMLMSLHNEAVTTDTQERFREAYRNFEEVRRHFRGTIRDHIEEEVAEMIHSIEERALELGVPISEPSIDDLTAKDLVDTLPLIMIEYRNNQRNPTEAARNLRLPENSIQTFWNTFNSMRTTKPLERDTESHSLFLGGGLGYSSLSSLYEPMVHKQKLFGIILSALGPVLVARPSKGQREGIPRYLEDTSAQFWLQHATPIGSADSLTIPSFEW